MLGLATVVTVLDPRQLLPPREGSLVLVLGGTAVLVLSLGLALITDGSRLQRRSPPTPSVGPRPKRPSGSPSSGTTGRRRRSDRDLLETLLKASARASVGTPKIVTENPGPHPLILLDCLTCRGSTPSPGCEWKRQTLERALREFDPEARVVRVSCMPEERRACIFEIRAGDLTT